MKQVQLKTVKLGDYFKRTKRGPVWVKGEYLKGDKSYSVFKFADINHESFIKPQSLVWVDFTF